MSNWVRCEECGRPAIYALLYPKELCKSCIEKREGSSGKG